MYPVAFLIFILSLMTGVLATPITPAHPLASANSTASDTGMDDYYYCGYLAQNSAPGHPISVALDIKPHCTMLQRPGYGVLNLYCGLCVTFEDNNCQGKITWQGGPANWERTIPISYSFVCR